MLARTQKWSAVLAVVLCLSAGGVGANEELYQKAAPSCALITRPGAAGTGWLVDAEHRLMITAGHVVAKEGGFYETVEVVFAQVKDGAVINDREHYDRNRATLVIKARVVVHDRRRDLAILELETVPAGVQALKLADKSPRPGADVHVIGNSTVNLGALFAYCQGKVRNVFRWDPPTNPIVARVVSHHAPTNHGDSGGPVLNNHGEVVAFISLGTDGVPPPKGEDFHAVQVTDHSIAVEEIRAALSDLATKVATR